MDPIVEKVGTVLLLPAGFLARWVWERLWRRKDAAIAAATDAEKAAKKAQADKMEAIETQVQAVERRVADVETAARGNSHHLGLLEANQNRLDGKVDGLQKHWTGRFDKLEEEVREGFKGVNEKLEYKLDNLRMELRGDQQGTEERMLTMQTEHQKRVHDRLNIMASEQAKGLNQLLDDLVERIAEPRPSPSAPKPGGT